MTNGTTGSHSRDLDLAELLDGIVGGEVVLPNFQRDFDWNEPDVISLLATVLRGWPAGSLLIMDGRPSFFDVREFEDAPVRSNRIRRVVLDGQQRLTSLFHAFRGVGPTIYALRVNQDFVGEPSPEELEDALIGLTRERFESASIQKDIREGRLIPLHVAPTAAGFYEWRDQIVDASPEEKRAEVGYRLGQAYKYVLSKANRYRFPAMLLDTELEPSAIARIFERINRTGMRLSTFDLLVARSYSKQWNLRQVWQEAHEESELLADFLGEDGLMVAQTIALRKERDVRQPAVLDLPRETIHEEWSTTVQAMERACRFVVDIGAIDASWLPYKTHLLPLAALATEFKLEESTELLVGWLFGSGLTSSYDVASSTVAVEDYLRLRRCIVGVEPPPQFEVSRRDLRSATRKRQAATWRTVRTLLLHHGGRDMLTGRALSESISDGVTTLSAVPRQPGDESPHLLVLAQLLVERQSVRALRTRPLANRDFAELQRLPLASQFLTPQALTEGPAALIESRLLAIEVYLTSTYGALINFID